MKQDGNSKIFYSMGEVAEMFDVNQSLIRCWEKEFSILKPKRNSKGNRLFTDNDIETLKKIYHLVKEKKMTIKGANEYLKSSKNIVGRNAVVSEKLGYIKMMLADIYNELSDIEEENENYE